MSLNRYIVIGLYLDGNTVFSTYILADNLDEAYKIFEITNNYRQVKPDTIKLFKINSDNSIPIEFYEYKNNLTKIC